MFGAFSTHPWIICDPSTESYWRGQSLQADTEVHVDSVGTLGFSRTQLVFSRTTPVGTQEDVMVCSMSWAACVGDTATKLGSPDKTAVDTAIATWWTSTKPQVSSQYTLRETRWYDFSPISSRPGPVVVVTPSGVTGGLASCRNADQLAVTMTFKTASRKHWGRIYTPFAGTTSIDTTYGRLINAQVDFFHNPLTVLMRVVGGTGLVCPVVASTQYKAVLGIREHQTDNIIDVIRSRRARNATYFKRDSS